MTPLESLICELWSYGYSIWIEGENIRFHHFGSIEPERDRFNYLIEQIKKDKAAAIEYIKHTLHQLDNESK